MEAFAPRAQQGLHHLFLVQFLVQTALFALQGLTQRRQAELPARSVQLTHIPPIQTLQFVSSKF